MNAFEITNLRKSFSDFELGPFDLTLESGTVLGYVGPNGAGKSTTLHCMMGLVVPDSGEVKIFGKLNNPNNIDWKFDVGYVGDAHSFYENWTVAKNLKFIKGFYPNWSDQLTASLVKRLDLSVDKKVRDLSTGNRVKLDLIRALSYRPKLLLLDEPTNGLDPVVRAELLDFLFEYLESEDSAIFYSTHILSDINQIADELVFINNGKIRQRTTKDDLLENFRKFTFTSNAEIGNIRNAISLKVSGKTYKVISDNYFKTSEHLKELPVQNLEESRLSIEEITVEVLKGLSEK